MRAAARPVSVGVGLMLSTIPARILRDTAVFFIPTGMDKYQQTVNKTEIVRRVHLQSDNSTRKTGTNTEVVLRGVLFIDARLSFPTLDYWALQESAQAAGAVMTVSVTDRSGKTTGPYTVLTIDGLPDDEGNTHHWELSLV